MSLKIEIVPRPMGKRPCASRFASLARQDTPPPPQEIEDAKAGARRPGTAAQDALIIAHTDAAYIQRDRRPGFSLSCIVSIDPSRIGTPNG